MRAATWVVLGEQTCTTVGHYFCETCLCVLFTSFISIVTVPMATTTEPFYTTIWFIAVVSTVSFILLIIVLIVVAMVIKRSCNRLGKSDTYIYNSKLKLFDLIAPFAFLLPLKCQRMQAVKHQCLAFDKDIWTLCKIQVDIFAN